MSAQRPSVFIKSEEIAEAAKHFSAHMQSIRTQELESQISPLLEMNELALASLEKSLAGEREVSQRDGVLAHQDSKMGLADSVLKAFLADIQQKYEAQETQYHQRMSEYRSAVGRVTQQVIGHARALLAESFKLDWSDPAAIDLKNVALCGVVRLNNILNDHRQADEKSIAESTKKIWQLDSKLLTQKDATSEAIKSARALAGLQQKLKQLQTQCDHLHRVTCKKEAQLEKMQAQFESELKQVRVRVAVAPSWPKERSPLFHGISFLFAPPPAAASALTPSTPEFAPSHLGSPLYMMPAAVSVPPVECAPYPSFSAAQVPYVRGDAPQFYSGHSPSALTPAGVSSPLFPTNEDYVPLNPEASEFVPRRARPAYSAFSQQACVFVPPAPMPQLAPLASARVPVTPLGYSFVMRPSDTGGSAFSAAPGTPVHRFGF